MRPQRFAAGALCAVLLCTFAGCGGGSSSSSGGGEITYWARGANERINKLLVAGWNADHRTKVKLLAVPDAQYEQKFAAAVQAGTPPDVATLDVVTIPDLIRGDALADISDRAKAMPYFDKLAPSYVKQSTRDGRVYALPENVDASTLFWNKQLFRRAGLDPDKPPRTFAEITADAKKISALGHGISGAYFSGQCTGCASYSFNPFVWASGGDFVNAAGTKATLTDPAVVQSLQFYHGLWKNRYVPTSAKSDTGASWVSSFGSGKIGIETLGAFAIPQLKQNYPAVKFGVSTIPGRDGGESSFTGGDVIALPKGGHHESAAWQFVKWSLSEKAQVDVYAKDGELVARSDLANNRYNRDPNLAAEYQALKVGRLPVYYPGNVEIDSQTGPYFSAFQKIVFGGKDAHSTLDRANGQQQKLLDQNG